MEQPVRPAYVLATLLTLTACATGSPARSSSSMPSSAPTAPTAASRGAASTPGAVAAPTTVIVVRHAEKATGQGDDPHLSEAGSARAGALARALGAAGVTAVITTQFVRTAETALPTARAAGVVPEVVAVKWDSIPSNATDIAAAVRRHAGGVVLVVGHSNTVPDIVAALGAERPGEICDVEYDRMEIVSLPQGGGARLIESRYGAPTPAEAGCASMR